MNVAYLDTSCAVALVFGEPTAASVAAAFEQQERLVTSDLFEAELLATLRREGVEGYRPELLSQISWLRPERRLTIEIDAALKLGYLRGADVWHLGCASHFRQRLGGHWSFLTLDQRQLQIAQRAGFDTPLAGLLAD